MKFYLLKLIFGINMRFKFSAVHLLICFAETYFHPITYQFQIPTLGNTIIFFLFINFYFVRRSSFVKEMSSQHLVTREQPILNVWKPLKKERKNAAANIFYNWQLLGFFSKAGIRKEYFPSISLRENHLTSSKELIPEGDV